MTNPDDVSQKPCPCCASERLNTFSHFTASDDHTMMEIRKVQCLDCLTEAPEWAWNTRPGEDAAKAEGKAEQREAVDKLISALDELRVCGMAVVGAELGDPDADDAFDMWHASKDRARELVADLRNGGSNVS